MNTFLLVSDGMNETSERMEGSGSRDSTFHLRNSSQNIKSNKDNKRKSWGDFYTNIWMAEYSHELVSLLY